MSFIKKCKAPLRQLQQRISFNFRPLSRLHMDIKVMPKSYQGHISILCTIDEVTNYLITVTIHQSIPEEIGDVLIDNVVSKYCIADYVKL